MRMLARHTGVPRHPATRRYVAITRRSDHHDAATVAWAALVEDPALRIVCAKPAFLFTLRPLLWLCVATRECSLLCPRGPPANCAAVMRVDPKSPWRPRLATCNRLIEKPVAANGVAYEPPVPAVSVMGRYTSPLEARGHRDAERGAASQCRNQCD